MFFSITVEISNEAVKKVHLVDKSTHFLEEELKTKEYGKGLNGILIGFICTNEPKGYEFFKEREPKYHKSMQLKLRTGSIKVDGFLVYDIKFSQEEHDRFVTLNEKESLDLFLDKIKNSPMPLDLIPENLEFNKQQFLKEFHEMLDSMKSSLI